MATFMHDFRRNFHGSTSARPAEVKVRVFKVGHAVRKPVQTKLQCRTMEGALGSKNKEKKNRKVALALRPPRPATGVSRALRARSLSESVARDALGTLFGHSGARGPNSPGDKNWGHSRSVPSFWGLSRRHSRRHFGPSERPL